MEKLLKDTCSLDSTVFENKEMFSLLATTTGVFSMALQCKELRIYDGPSSVVMEIVISGKLTQEDYENFESEFERVLMTQGRVRFKAKLLDFNGWKEDAMWKYVKFNSKHFAEVDRICIVGEARWAEALTFFYRPFAQAAVRFFDLSAEQEADKWIAATPEP